MLPVTKSVSHAGVQTPGTELTYTIAYTNTGQGTATKVVFTDPIPSGTIFISESASGADATITYSIDGANYQDLETYPVNYIRWTFDSIGPGVSGTLEFRVKIQ